MKIFLIRRLLSFVALFFAFVCWETACEDNGNKLTVQTKVGKILGSVMSTDRNNKFYAFRGVPYAKPPLNNLRFKAPVPVESWNDTLDGTRAANDCLQFQLLNISFTGDEDCLYLNVFTPAYTSYDVAKAVMFFIHGGGFSTGSGSDTTFGPQRLLDKDIVLVTINYRIGAFGFLSTGNQASPGNYGLLDQVQALKWVQENIAFFGGDPKRVTIFGQSVGSSSVFYHMVSPLSKGQFHGVIAQSGAPFGWWAFSADPRAEAVKLGERLKCPTNCSSKLVKCIKGKPAVNVLVASSTIGSSISRIKFIPVADIQYGGSFVSDNPNVLLKNNIITKVPVIGGIVRDEGILFHYVMSGKSGIQGKKESFVQHILSELYPVLVRESDVHSKAVYYIKENYFRNASTWRENVHAFNKFFGDSVISEDMDTVLLLLVNNSVPTYAYKFNYRGQYSVTDVFPNNYDVENAMKRYVAHGDDLQYLFRCSHFKSDRLNPQDQKMADIMLELWTNFAKTGVPTLGSVATMHGNLRWDQPSADHFRYLNLNLESKMVGSNLASTVWRKLFNDVIKAELDNADPDHPMIETALGRIRGGVLKSDKGAKIFAFRGIPYALPPVKNLRFKAPHPVNSYQGVLDATQDGRQCLQLNSFKKELTGDEDCLNANIYIPRLPSSESHTKLPVMVFIHGGAFLRGSGTSTAYGPQRLLDKNIILVTFNYRLGPLGFLSTGDESAPGNYGLLDQVMLLRWVRDYIDSFGGDPERVTIFGESAGSVSVMLHLVSPLSHGLFHAAIAQSGSSSSKSSIQSYPAKTAETVASLLNCPTHSSAEMVACLRKKPALDIVYHTAYKELFERPSQRTVFRFKPVVDKVAGNNSFIPDYPSKLMAEGKFVPVPVMLGTTKDEGMLSYINLMKVKLSNPDELKPGNMDEILDLIIPYEFVNKNQSSLAAKEIKEAYFTKETAAEKYRIIKGFISILSDVNFVYDVSSDVERLTKRGISPFVYKLTYRGKQSFTDLDKANSDIIPKDLNAVSHIDDLQYLFYVGFFDSFHLSEEDQKVANIMLTLWTNFAKSRIPSMDGSNYLGDKFVWEQSGGNQPRYLELASAPKMVDGHLCDKMDLWRKIFKETSKPHHLL